MSFNDVMVDIETLSTQPCAAVIQIAAIRFDRDTGEMSDTFSESIDIKKAEYSGAFFSISTDTLNWWKSTPEKRAVFEDIERRKKPIGVVLDKFSQFINTSDKIWAHESFDMNHIEWAYFTCDKKIPWRFMNLRGIRSVVDVSGINLKSYDWKQKTHDALDDCRFQIKYICDALKTIKGNM